MASKPLIADATDRAVVRAVLTLAVRRFAKQSRSEACKFRSEAAAVELFAREMVSHLCGPEPKKGKVSRGK